VEDSTRELTNYQKLSALLKLYGFISDSFDKRRAYEWKMSLALWTGLGVQAGFLFPHKSNMTPNDLVSLASIYFLLWLIYTLFWSAFVAKRQLEDLSKIRELHTQIDSIINKSSAPFPASTTVTYLNGLFDFASITKSTYTAGLMFLAWSLLS